MMASLDSITDDNYCRDVESYLCRQNGGHLIRIVGPAFDTVSQWAEQGIPLKVVYRGIDRYFERQNAKGPRRRPVRVEFCEADVLDVFDEWRRAVGVSVARETAAEGEGQEAAVDEGHKPYLSLKAHLERASARLAAVHAPAPLAEALIAARRAIEEMLSAAPLRGDARRAALERLRDLDAEMLQAARNQCDESTLAELTVEADQELSAFRARMPAEAYEQSRRVCVTRLIRERYRLPVLGID